MRKSDKKKNLAKVNLLAEQRYLESKGLINEGTLHNYELIVGIGNIKNYHELTPIVNVDYDSEPFQIMDVDIVNSNEFSEQEIKSIYNYIKSNEGQERLTSVINNHEKEKFMNDPKRNRLGWSPY